MARPSHLDRARWRAPPFAPLVVLLALAPVVVMLALMVFVIVFQADPDAERQLAQTLLRARAAAVSAPFADCRAARAAGADPVYRLDPGYGRHLDGDGDGIGCEPPRS